MTQLSIAPYLNNISGKVPTYLRVSHSLLSLRSIPHLEDRDKSHKVLDSAQAFEASIFVSVTPRF